MHFPATPTDDSVISVYGSLDGTSWAATPLVDLVLDKDVDPNSIDFIVTGVSQFRIGLKRSGLHRHAHQRRSRIPRGRRERLTRVVRCRRSECPAGPGRAAVARALAGAKAVFPFWEADGSSVTRRLASRDGASTMPCAGSFATLRRPLPAKRSILRTTIRSRSPRASPRLSRC